MLAPVSTPANPIPRNPITVHHRVYSASAGTGIDVPVFDANELEANGWLRMGTYSGPTSARPAPLDADFSGITLIGLAGGQIMPGATLGSTMTPQEMAAYKRKYATPIH